MINKKILIILFLTALFLVIITFYINSLSINKNIKIVPSVIPQPSGSLSPPFPSVQFTPVPTNYIPPFTGYRAITLPPGQEKEVEEESNLRGKLPVSTDNFSISYDYKKYKFIVILKAPFDQNKVIFKQWLNSNGFGDIPESEFVYQTG